MLSLIHCAAVSGLTCELVRVETDITTGFPSCSVVGLPDVAVREAKERIRSAIKHSGYEFPYNHRIVINLAPGFVKKTGSAFDMPMALGVLTASGVCAAPPGDSLFAGELALDGSVRFTRGILPIAMFAREHTIKTLYVPHANIQEAQLIRGVNIIPIKHLRELVEHVRGVRTMQPAAPQTSAYAQHYTEEHDFAHIKGQEAAKRALEIAAAGGHNVLLSGVPGAGKTLLARSLPTILPPMSEEEILEVTKIYSVAGLLPHDNPLVTVRPFRTPHHSASRTALIGGGASPRPGEVSLAHRGILFLDELPEFPRSVTESLRQPLEDGSVTVSRAQETITYPARFMLIASRNPCPCGYLHDSKKECTCLPQQINMYEQRVSGPLLDRIDIHLDVARVEVEKLTGADAAEASATVRERVMRARAMQTERFSTHTAKDIAKTKRTHTNSTRTNAEMSSQDTKKHCVLDAHSSHMLNRAVETLHLSARAYYRVLKVARTIADCTHSEKIYQEHVAEALQYRPRSE